MQANRAAGVANRQIQIDVGTFIAWVDAYQQGDTKLAAFYFRRFRPEFRPAVTAWVATRPLTNPRAPLTPFEMPQYSSAANEEADALEAKGAAASLESHAFVDEADRYTLCVVMFALSLFFAGISLRLRSERVQLVALGVGWIVFVGTVGWMATFPASLAL